MNKGNQDSSSRNNPDFVQEQPSTTARLGENESISVSVSSNPPSQETNRLLNIGSLFRSVFENEQQISFSGNITDFAPEQPGSAATFVANESASTPEVSSSLVQQTSRNPYDEFLLLQGPLQTSFSGNTSASIPALPGSVDSFGKSQLESTSETSSCLSLQIDKDLANLYLFQNQFQSQHPSPLSEENPASFPEWPGSAVSFAESSSASTSEASRSPSQQRGRRKEVVSLSQTVFNPFQQTSVSGNAPASFPEWQGTTLSFSENQTASTSNASSFLSQRAVRHPAGSLFLKTQFQHDQQTSFSGNSPASVPEPPEATASLIENQSTSISEESQQLENHSKLLSLLNAPLKRDIETSLQDSGQHSLNDITSPSKRQVTSIHPSHKSRISSSPAELTFAPKEYEIAVHAKQKIPSFSSSVETEFSSREEETAVSSRKRKEVTFPPVKATSASKETMTAVRPRQKGGALSSSVKTSALREQVTAECPEQQTGLRPILGEPKSQAFYTKRHPEFVGLASSTDETMDFHHSQEYSKTSRRTSSIPSYLSENFPTILSCLLDPRKLNIGTSLRVREQHSSINITSSKKQETSIRPSHKTRKSLSPVSKKRETTVRAKRSFSSPVEITFASRDQETAVRPKGKLGTRSSSVKASTASKEQMTAVLPRHQKGALPSSIETTSASREQVTAECPEQQIYLTSSTNETTDFYQSQKKSSETSERTSSISQQQFSASSPESSLNNSSQNSKAVQDTETKKSVDRLEKRLGLFDEYICVICFVEFSTLDELMRHEPIHFNK